MLKEKNIKKLLKKIIYIYFYIKNLLTQNFLKILTIYYQNIINLFIKFIYKQINNIYIIQDNIMQKKKMWKFLNIIIYYRLTKFILTYQTHNKISTIFPIINKNKEKIVVNNNIFIQENILKFKLLKILNNKNKYNTYFIWPYIFTIKPNYINISHIKFNQIFNINLKKNIAYINKNTKKPTMFLFYYILQYFTILKKKKKINKFNYLLKLKYNKNFNIIYKNRKKNYYNQNKILNIYKLYIYWSFIYIKKINNFYRKLLKLIWIKNIIYMENYINNIFKKHCLFYIKNYKIQKTIKRSFTEIINNLNKNLIKIKYYYHTDYFIIKNRIYKNLLYLN